MHSSRSIGVTLVLCLFALAPAYTALIGCEAGDGTSPLPPVADAAADHSIARDAGDKSEGGEGGETKMSDAAAKDAESAADTMTEASAAADATAD